MWSLCWTVVAICFPPRERWKFFGCLALVCDIPKWSRKFCREERVGMCEAPCLSTVSYFFTKTLLRKVYATSNSAILLSLPQIFSDSNYLKNVEFKEVNFPSIP